MSYSGLLAHRVDIYRKNPDKTDSRGYSTPVDYGSAPIYENVKCRIQNLFESSAGLRIQTSGVTAENDYLGFFLKGQDIQKDDKLIVSVPAQMSGMELFVKPVQPIYNSNSLHHKEVYMGLSET